MQEKITNAKKPSEINAIKKEFLKILAVCLNEIELERKYTKFIRIQRDERQKNEIENLKKQRDSLILKININRKDDQVM